MVNKCPVCGEELGAYASDELTMKREGMCFSCSFWKSILKEDSKRAPHTWCVIDGTHYVIGDENQGGEFRFKGFCWCKVCYKIP